MRLPTPGQWCTLEITYTKGPDGALYVRCHGVYDNRDRAENSPEALAGEAAPVGPLTVDDCKTFRIFPNGKLYDYCRRGSDDHIPSWDAKE